MIQKQLKSDFLNLPNQLTIFRILCVPAIIILMIENTPVLDLIAAIIFTVASLTDFADGWVARRIKCESKIGALLDPLADKLLIVSVLIVLLHQDKIDPVIPVIIIWREFGILTLRSIAVTQGIIISASSLAKHKTFLQIIGLLGIIIGKGNEFWGINWFAIGYSLILISLFVSVLSGYQYLRNYIKASYK